MNINQTEEVSENLTRELGCSKSKSKFQITGVKPFNTSLKPVNELLKRSSGQVASVPDLDEPLQNISKMRKLLPLIKMEKIQLESSEKSRSFEDDLTPKCNFFLLRNMRKNPKLCKTKERIIETDLMRELRTNALIESGNRPVCAIEFNKIVNWTSSGDICNEITGTAIVKWKIAVVDRQDDVTIFDCGFAVVPLFPQIEETMNEEELSQLSCLKLRQFTCPLEKLHSMREMYVIVETIRFVNSDTYCQILSGKRRRTERMNPQHNVPLKGVSKQENMGKATVTPDIKDYVQEHRFGCKKLMDSGEPPFFNALQPKEMVLLSKNENSLNIDFDMGTWAEDLSQLKKVDAVKYHSWAPRLVFKVQDQRLRRVKTKLRVSQITPIKMNIKNSSPCQQVRRKEKVQKVPEKCQMRINQPFWFRKQTTHNKPSQSDLSNDEEPQEYDKKLTQYLNMDEIVPIVDIKCLPFKIVRRGLRTVNQTFLVDSGKGDGSKTTSNYPLPVGKFALENATLLNCIALRRKQKIGHLLNPLPNPGSEMQVVNFQLSDERVIEYKEKQLESFDEFQKLKNQKKKRKGTFNLKKDVPYLYEAGADLNTAPRSELASRALNAEDTFDQPQENGGIHEDLYGFPIPVPGLLVFPTVKMESYNVLLREFLAGYGWKEGSYSVPRRYEMLKEFAEMFGFQIKDLGLDEIFLKHLELMGTCSKEKQHDKLWMDVFYAYQEHIMIIPMKSIRNSYLN